jgi:two-component system, NarL family, sensor kinase
VVNPDDAQDPGIAQDLNKELEKLLARLHAETNERRRLEEQLHSLPNQILQAQDAERRRIARELHDGVNQLLGSIRFRLLHLLSAAPEQARTIGDLAKLLEKAVNEVRRISNNLRPSELDDFGLVAAIEGLITEFRTRTNVRVDFQRGQIPKRLPPDVELALYRILQEALANVEKHAGATNVVVTLFADANFATMNVRDDGRGLPEKERPGIGLINMRERAHALGGVFAIKSQPGHGTEVSVHLKLEK